MISTSLAEFEQNWRGGASLAAVRERVAAQGRGELLPELAGVPESGYYFLHIPKTAGTSLNRFLDQAAEPGARFPVWLWDHVFGAGQESAACQSRFFSGHFHLHLERFLGRRLRRMVLLRDPVARTISHYLHVRRDPGHPFLKLAQTMSLHDFCQHPQTRHMVENYQARYLVDFGLDPRIPARFCTSEDFRGLRLQILLEQLTLSVVSDELLLQAAEANLQQFAAVGLTEKFAESVRRFGAALHYPAGTVFDERHNVAEDERISEADLDARTRLAILRATEVDSAIYRRVAASFPQ